jgi:TPR repeat protein
VQQSQEEAIKWIRRAADQGHADAKAYLFGGDSPPASLPAAAKP